MMTDKARSESALWAWRDKPVAHLSEKACVAYPEDPRRSGLILFERLVVLKSERFQRVLCGVRDLVNAPAPYFIHIVRANRAADMIGRCLGVSQAGQQEKQTVAG